MEKILLVQFIAHIIADFFAQPEYVCRKKRLHLLKSWHIYIHMAIVFVTSFALTPACDFVWYAAGIAVLHFGIDALKCVAERHIKQENNHFLFFTDQIAHIAVVWTAVGLYWKMGGDIPGCINQFTTQGLLVATGFLLCLKPANILTRVCLATLGTNRAIGDSLENESLQKAGRWIGSIERSMTFGLVLLGQYTAIGFIIAAKSVLRYGDNTHKTEYVLIGTLLSFGIAFALGVGITSGFFENVINIISYKI
jgi:hypothetical protein